MAATFDATVPMLVVRSTVTNTNPGSNASLTTTRGLKVIDVVGNKGLVGGGAGDTILVGNAANAITDAMVLNIAANTSFRAASIDTAFSTVAAGGAIRVTVAFNTDNGCWANVYCVPA